MTLHSIDTIKMKGGLLHIFGVKRNKRRTDGKAHIYYVVILCFCVIGCRREEVANEISHLYTLILYINNVSEKNCGSSVILGREIHNGGAKRD